MIVPPSMRHGLIALWCLVAVACAQRTNEPPKDRIAAAEPPAAATTPLSPDAPTPEPRSVEPFAELDARAQRSVAAPEPAPPPAAPEAAPPPAGPEHAPPPVSLADTREEGSALAAVAPVAPVEAIEPERDFVSSPVASPAGTLDLSSLLRRLRKTNAINLRTKVAVKHESDDLLEQFRAYHTQHGVVTLAELRRSYDSLFHKLHSLLEDADPPLARDLDQSQAAIWELLADPRKFGASDSTPGA